MEGFILHLTHLSLFSGGGGGDLACKWAGFETLAFVEKDEYCQKLLNQNYPGIPVHGNIFDFSGSEFDRVTLLTAGFPCQPFSRAGNREGSKDGRYLWPEVLRVIRECRPTWFIGENVNGLTSMVEFDEILLQVAGEGYATRAFVFPAAALGADHRRDRVFIVAQANGKRQLESKRAIHTTDGRQPPQPRPTFSNRWSARPDLRRIFNGVANRIYRDRIRVLGNSIVPQQWYPILKGIADIEQAA